MCLNLFDSVAAHSQQTAEFIKGDYGDRPAELFASACLLLRRRALLSPLCPRFTKVCLPRDTIRAWSKQSRIRLEQHRLTSSVNRWETDLLSFHLCRCQISLSCEIRDFFCIWGWNMRSEAFVNKMGRLCTLPWYSTCEHSELAEYEQQSR